MKETQSFGSTEFAVMQWAKARGIYDNAYKVIEPRKGHMNKDGVFVKEA